MNTMKTLLLAGFAALSLGVGAANAQSLVPSATEGAFFSAPAKAATPQVHTNANANGVQSGSSDVDTTRNTNQFRYEWGTLANPG
jgi:hypothetical protein